MGAKNSRSSAPTPIALEASHGAHAFEVANYSKHRDLGVGSFFRSATFLVGGCSWSIRFYSSYYKYEDYVAVALELMTKDAVVSVSYDMRLVDQATGARYSVVESSKLEFDTRCVEGYAPAWCIVKFMKKSELEASTYLRDDRLVIECTLRVIKGTRIPEVQVESKINVPTSDLPEHLGRLLKDREGADVTFVVHGEDFPVHRIVLAARSPVFKAELLGPMKEGSVDRIAIDDIQPAVFDALLHFIYTDSLPAMDATNKEDIIADLLVAADRYAMDRLKLVCEQTLSRSLTIENVSDILIIADRHNCWGLKDVCIEFIISNRMDDVKRTEGYSRLKRDHPSVLIDLSEKVVKLCKI